jgi:RNA polymerase sigma-70 factor (ECF subfamily)
MGKTGVAEEGELIARTLAGDDRAYAVLVHRHQSIVYNIACRLVGDREEAREIAQEAFLRAYTALDTFDCRRSFAPWLYRIATNLSINALKRKKYAAISLDAPPGQDGEPLEVADNSMAPESMLIRSEFQDRLRREILALPVKFRIVIELRHFQGLSYQEIATLLGISLANVKSRLFRARQRLRERLTEDTDSKEIAQAQGKGGTHGTYDRCMQAP